MFKDDSQLAPKTYSIKGYSKNGRGFVKTLSKIFYGVAIVLVIVATGLFIYFSF